MDLYIYRNHNGDLFITKHKAVAQIGELPFDDALDEYIDHMFFLPTSWFPEVKEGQVQPITLSKSSDITHSIFLAKDQNGDCYMYFNAPRLESSGSYSSYVGGGENMYLGKNCFDEIYPLGLPRLYKIVINAKVRIIKRYATV